MTSQRNLDPADRALADEFGNYISEVARKIVDPLEEVTESSLAAVSSKTGAAVSKIDASVSNHIEQFDRQSGYLTHSLSTLKDEMETVVKGIAEGHDLTRAELLGYAQKHSDDARKEMRAQTDRLERSFLDAMEPKMTQLNEEVLSLFKQSVIKHQQAVEAKIGKLKFGLAFVAIEVLVLGLFLYPLK